MIIIIIIIIIINIIIIVIIYYLLTLWEIFTSVLAGCFSLETEWQHVFPSFQDSSAFWPFSIML